MCNGMFAFQVLSNAIYKSVEHRVIVNSNKDRVSLALFYNPKSDLLIEPAKELVTKDRPALYQPMTFDEYRLYIRMKGPCGKAQVESLICQRWFQLCNLQMVIELHLNNKTYCFFIGWLKLYDTVRCSSWNWKGTAWITCQNFPFMCILISNWVIGLVNSGKKKKNLIMVSDMVDHIYLLSRLPSGMLTKAHCP